jgi:hypothetical protein
VDPSSLEKKIQGEPLKKKKILMGSPRAKKCFTWSRAWIYLILFIFSVALLAVGNTLHREKRPEVRVHSSMKDDTCMLAVGQVVECEPGKHVAVWRRLTEATGGPDMAVVSPFAVRDSPEDAREDLHAFGNPKDYGPNVTTRFNCMCARVTRINHLYPNVPCTLQNTCMLQKIETHYVQTVGWVYGYAADTLLAIGSLLLILTFYGTLILMLELGCCSCCFRNSKVVEVSYRDTHKELPESD